MKKWTTVEADPSVVEELAKAQGLPVPVAAVLVGRGYTTPQDIDLYLNPRLSKLSDPFELSGMASGVSRIWSALEAHEKIVVYGDYDVDGITSTALLVTVLKALGADVGYFLPHRVDDGYGLSVEAVGKCISESNPSLIVTVDCGTGSIEAVEAAGRHHVDVVVTDHHEPSSGVAKAVAVINPKLDETSASKVLAGVGVAFKLCHGLLKEGRARQNASAMALDLRQHLAWVALGTVCDMVPLLGENRTFVRHGLSQFRATSCLGLQALIEVAGISGDIDAYHLGFLLGPRLNASGRLGDATSALELLLTEDEDRAHELAKQLDQQNVQRKKIESETVDQACEMIEESFDAEKEFGLVVAAEGWHPGVVGIVASRLARKYHRPAIVIAIDDQGVGKGSCRSISSFNMLDGLSGCDDLLMQWGGHHMAAGLQVKAEQIDAFRAQFNRICVEALSGEDLRVEQRVDAWIPLSEVSRILLDAQESMGPFGIENPQPVWAVRGARVMGQPKILKDRHLRFSITSGGAELGGIGFGLAEQGPLPEGAIDVAFRLKLNAFRGRETLEMMVQDVRGTVNDGP